MSKRIKRHAKALHYLASCDSNISKSVIKASKPDLICCLSEICHNLLRGNIPLTTKEKTKLTRYKKEIRGVADKKLTQQSKKRLIQKGGFLSALLAPLVSLVGPLVKSIFEK